MLLEDIVLLHIGDIHFRDVIKKDNPKDNGISHDLHVIDEAIRIRNRYEIINRQLIKELHKSILAILISGDLATGGTIKSYGDCLDFFRDKINVDFFDIGSNQKIFIVPGNHDIDRNSVSDEYILKFNHIIEALNEKGFPEIPCDDIKVDKIENDNSSCKLLVISVNSCIGCGDKRYFPENIRDIIEPFLIDYDDVMDTPFISTEHIERMVDVIQSESNKDFLPLILTHHNLLPLKRKDVAIHADLINSGIVRDKLLRLNKTILYIHGHVHDDPIEIIHSPYYEDSKIICISAPLLFPIEKNRGSDKFGFNKIKIISGYNSPLGCELTSYRLIDNFMDIDKRRIKFFKPPKSIGKINPEDKKILQLIKSEGRTYMSDLKNEMKTLDDKYPIEKIEKIVDRLDWLGLIDYTWDEPDSEMQSMIRVVAA